MARVLAECPPLEDGDVLMLNAPFHGGTHLPDITLIAPYYDGSSSPLFYVLNRAHHADVGSVVPASMPLADDVRQEGVIIPPTLLYRQGVLDEGFLNDPRGEILPITRPWPAGWGVPRDTRVWTGSTPT
jgi:N-methylhydantoinase B